MPNAPGAGQENEQYQWVHIDDFTPGVFDNSFISLAEPKLSAPVGAADAVDTWCCAALAGGLGLGPLPALTNSGNAATLPGGCTSAFLTGFAVNPGLDSVHDELIFVVECDNGTTHFLNAYSAVPAISALNSILAITGTTQPGIFGSPYPTWTRMTASGSGNPSPELVFPASISDGAAGGHLYIYPEILAPTTFTVQDLIVSGSSVTGQVICYGSRVIVLVGVNYSWPAGGGINTNENINFTDPPLSSSYGNQMTILGAEIPWGYGAWGSVSVGELMLIKKDGGGVALYGDIFSPSSVVEQPGIESTGDFVGRAAAGPLGLVYCSEQRGAWTWNGGNTATKISRQLRDAFYDATSPTGMLGNNYGFDVAHWQNWILFSNNYFYNMDTQSWWQMWPSDGNGNGTTVIGRTFWWWNQGRFGNQMYAAPLQFGTSLGMADNWWYMFDNEVAASHYQWKSLPIHVTTHGDRVIDIRKVMVRASEPSGTGSPTVTVEMNNTTVGSSTGVTIGADPTIISFNCGVKGAQDIRITLQCDNSAGDPAPIIHSIDIGYEIRAEVKPNN